MDTKINNLYALLGDRTNCGFDIIKDAVRNIMNSWGWDEIQALDHLEQLTRQREDTSLKFLNTKEYVLENPHSYEPAVEKENTAFYEPKRKKKKKYKKR